MCQDIGVLACMKKVETGDYIFCWRIRGFILSTPTICFNLIWFKMYFSLILVLFTSKIKIHDRVCVRNGWIDTQMNKKQYRVYRSFHLSQILLETVRLHICVCELEAVHMWIKILFCISMIIMTKILQE